MMQGRSPFYCLGSSTCKEWRSGTFSLRNTPTVKSIVRLFLSLTVQSPEFRKKRKIETPYLFLLLPFYLLAEIRIPFSNCRDLHLVPYGAAIPMIMDTIIVPKGFGIVPISLILGTMINLEDSGESPWGNRLVIMLRHIYHVSFLNLSKMTPVEWFSIEYVLSLLLVVFLGYWSNHEPPRVFSLIII